MRRLLLLVSLLVVTFFAHAQLMPDDAGEVGEAESQSLAHWSAVLATLPAAGRRAAPSQGWRSTQQRAARPATTRRAAARDEDMCSRDENSLCFDETCGLDLALLDTKTHEDVACDCVEQDIGYLYTNCNPDTNTRTLLYFWKPPATCLNGGSLPAPVTGLPCSLECFEGQYLDITSSPPVCRTCPAGTATPGSGHTWTQWNEWPAQFSTYCSTGGSQDRPCQPWQLRETNVDSGDNFDEHYLVSGLDLRLQIFSAVGSVRFEYAVNGDSSDIGYFSVDDLIYVAVQGSGPTTNWRTSPTIELDQGFHTLKWSYYKDFSRSRYEDRMKLRRVEVRGSLLDPIRCSLCPPGTYSAVEGASECLPCPANATSGWGSASCSTCTDDQHSYSQLGCLRLPNCTADDYGIYTTECVNGAHYIYSAWLEPRACLITDSSPELPHNTSEPCSPQCHVGQLTTSSGCLDCPDGEYASLDRTSIDDCASCKAGSATTAKILTVDGAFYALGSGELSWITTGCFGDCLSATESGWRAAGAYLDSGAGNGANSNTYLRLLLNMTYPGSVTVDYKLTCTAPSELLVYVGPVEVSSYQCDNSNSLRTATISDLPIGIHHIYFVYHKVTAPLLPIASDRVLISRIQVVGSTLGTSTGCQACPISSATSLAGQSFCPPCPAGSQTTAVGSQQCTDCPENYFSHTGSICYRCGANTRSEAGSPTCFYDPSNLQITTDQLDSPVAVRTFKIGPLAALGPIGPIVDTTRLSNTFYINLFNASMAGTLCAQPQPSFVENADDEDVFLETHACLVSTQQVATFTSSNATNLGNVIAFSYTQAVSTEGINVINLLASFSSPTSLARSTLTIICAPLAIGIEPITLSQADYTADLFHFTWLSKYGCPLCTAQDYDSSLSACSDGARTRRYFWKTRCVPGVELPPSESEVCEGVQVNVSLGVTIAIIVILVIGAFLSALAFLYNRWRRTQSQYEVLLGERAEQPSQREESTEPDPEEVEQPNP